MTARRARSTMMSIATAKQRRCPLGRQPSGHYAGQAISRRGVLSEERCATIEVCAGCWTGIEPDICVVREALEETGIVIRDPSTLSTPI